MSLRTDGAYRCDRCDTDVDNGGVHAAVIVTDLHPTRPGEVRVLHLCRRPRTGAPHGCAGHLLGPGALAAWTKENT